MVEMTHYQPEPGSLLTTFYGGDTAAVWEILEYLSGDRVSVRLVSGTEEWWSRVNKHSDSVKPGFTIPISSLNLEPPNEMLVLALAAQ
jgi:hypothetical protein